MTSARTVTGRCVGVYEPRSSLCCWAGPTGWPSLDFSCCPNWAGCGRKGFSPVFSWFWALSLFFIGNDRLPSRVFARDPAYNTRLSADRGGSDLGIARHPFLWGPVPRAARYPGAPTGRVFLGRLRLGIGRNGVHHRGGTDPGRYGLRGIAAAKVSMERAGLVAVPSRRWRHLPVSSHHLSDSGVGRRAFDVRAPGGGAGDDDALRFTFGIRARLDGAARHDYPKRSWERRRRASGPRGRLDLFGARRRKSCGRMVRPSPLRIQAGHHRGRLPDARRGPPAFCAHRDIVARQGHGACFVGGDGMGARAVTGPSGSCASSSARRCPSRHNAEPGSARATDGHLRRNRDHRRTGASGAPPLAKRTPSGHIGERGAGRSNVGPLAHTALRRSRDRVHGPLWSRIRRGGGGATPRGRSSDRCGARTGNPRRGASFRPGKRRRGVHGPDRRRTVLPSGSRYGYANLPSSTSGARGRHHSRRAAPGRRPGRRGLYGRVSRMLRKPSAIRGAYWALPYPWTVWIRRPSRRASGPSSRFFLADWA